MKLELIDGTEVYVNKALAVAAEPHEANEDDDYQNYQGDATDVTFAALTRVEDGEMDALVYTVRGTPAEVAEKLDLA